MENWAGAGYFCYVITLAHLFSASRHLWSLVPRMSTCYIVDYVQIRCFGRTGLRKPVWLSKHHLQIQIRFLSRSHHQLLLSSASKLQHTVIWTLGQSTRSPGSMYYRTPNCSTNGSSYSWRTIHERLQPSKIDHFLFEEWNYLCKLKIDWEPSPAVLRARFTGEVVFHAEESVLSTCSGKVYGNLNRIVHFCSSSNYFRFVRVLE